MDTAGATAPPEPLLLPPGREDPVETRGGLPDPTLHQRQAAGRGHRRLERGGSAGPWGPSTGPGAGGETPRKTSWRSAEVLRGHNRNSASPAPGQTSLPEAYSGNAILLLTSNIFFFSYSTRMFILLFKKVQRAPVFASVFLPPFPLGSFTAGGGPAGMRTSAAFWGRASNSGGPARQGAFCMGRRSEAAWSNLLFILIFLTANWVLEAGDAVKTG